MMIFVFLTLLILPTIVSSNKLLFILKQSVNLPALLELKNIIFNRHMLIPTISLKSVADLDLDSLESLGIKYLVFDKDNTLSLPYGEEIHPSLDNKMNEIKSHNLYKNSAAILSNSAGSSDDEDYKDAIKCEDGFGIPVIRHKVKKPGCVKEVIDHFSGTSTTTNESRSINNNNSNGSISRQKIKNEEICVVGDRLLTDVVFGNQNNMKTVLVKPLSIIKDHPVAVLIRFFERNILLPLMRLFT